jgi:hypothetical protein
VILLCKVRDYGPSWRHLGPSWWLSWDLLGHLAAILGSCLRVCPARFGGSWPVSGGCPARFGGLGRFLGDVPRVLGVPRARGVERRL